MISWPAFVTLWALCSGIYAGLWLNSALEMMQGPLPGPFPAPLWHSKRIPGLAVPGRYIPAHVCSRWCISPRVLLPQTSVEPPDQISPHLLKCGPTFVYITSDHSHGFFCNSSSSIKDEVNSGCLPHARPIFGQHHLPFFVFPFFSRHTGIPATLLGFCSPVFFVRPLHADRRLLHSLPPDQTKPLCGGVISLRGPNRTLSKKRVFWRFLSPTHAARGAHLLSNSLRPMLATRSPTHIASAPSIIHRQSHIFPARAQPYSFMHPTLIDMSTRGTQSKSNSKGGTPKPKIRYVDPGKDPPSITSCAMIGAWPKSSGRFNPFAEKQT